MGVLSYHSTGKNALEKRKISLQNAHAADAGTYEVRVESVETPEPIHASTRITVLHEEVTYITTPAPTHQPHHVGSFERNFAERDVTGSATHCPDGYLPCKSGHCLEEFRLNVLLKRVL